MRESSNVALEEEWVDLIGTARTYQANIKALKRPAGKDDPGVYRPRKPRLTMASFTSRVFPLKSVR
jgi:hypothetical protein